MYNVNRRLVLLGGRVPGGGGVLHGEATVIEFRREER